jgi:urease accessory protein
MSGLLRTSRPARREARPQRVKSMSAGQQCRRPSFLATHVPRARATTAVLVSLMWLHWAPAAHAHILQGEAGGILTGLGHPVSGLDHVLAMIAVGLWGAQLGLPALWLLPVTFPMVMALGGMLGLLGVPLPGVEVGIAASGVVLGLAVMSALRPPLAAAAVLVGVFGIFHGHAHGVEIPAGQSAFLYSMGFVVATGCLHGVGIAIGLVHRWAWGRALLRAAGAGVAVAGVVFLWQAVA